MARATKDARRAAVVGSLGLLLVVAAGAQAQGLGGLWGSPLYRVQLAVSGSTVSGTFALLDNPQAPPGKIVGQVRPGGKSFVADWTFTAGPDVATFKTCLELTGRNALLNGYRWTEETPPTSFALHRAVNGQLVATVSEDNPIGATTGVTPGGGTTTVTPGGGILTPPTTTPSIELITCESVVDGNPSKVGTDFTAPKSVTACIHYKNLPANSTVAWAWTHGGRPEANLTKTLSGSGWHWHGLRSETAVLPGAYVVTISLNGKTVAQRTITVRAASGTTTTTTTPTPSPKSPGAHVVVCESAANGVAKNSGTSFTKPKSLACLVKYHDFPNNSQLKWVWTRNGAQIASNTRVVSGTGWAWHGLTGAPALTPGTYKVTVSVAGNTGTSVTVTVK
ncbi:MAG: hypothetical protein KKI08_11940 [Armatimonadetes bacterium]|nr:hypothetical protein [Armatimonadota bacterium]